MLSGTLGLRASSWLAGGGCWGAGCPRAARGRGGAGGSARGAAQPPPRYPAAGSLWARSTAPRIRRGGGQGVGGAAEHRPVVPGGTRVRVCVRLHACPGCACTAVGMHVSVQATQVWQAWAWGTRVCVHTCTRARGCTIPTHQAPHGQDPDTRGGGLAPAHPSQRRVPPQRPGVGVPVPAPAKGVLGRGRTPARPWRGRNPINEAWPSFSAANKANGLALAGGGVRGAGAIC